jgi:hypothetical protein
VERFERNEHFFGGRASAPAFSRLKSRWQRFATHR